MLPLNSTSATSSSGTNSSSNQNMNSGSGSGGGGGGGVANSTNNNNNIGSGSGSGGNNNNELSKTNDALIQSKDAQTMINVLKDMGVEDYEPRVVSQLLEFSYRYITNLLEDAKAFSNHAGKKNIDSEDIKMAIKSKVDYSFTTTPPRDLLMEISKSKNKNPLPPIKYHAGIRLPPDRFCLHAPNYSVKTSQNVSMSSQQTYGSGQNQARTNSQSQQITAIARNENTFLTSAMPSKRPRADEDDYDI